MSTAPDAPPRNDRVLRALRREPVDRTPVWLMRQAGRYLPEYRATRQRAGSFLALAKTPELACEVTLQPLARYPLDAAIVFSDILTIPDAMGLGLGFKDGEGPYFERPIRSIADIERLAAPDPERELRYVMDAVRLSRLGLARRVPLIGFSGSPWTLACYMVEGHGGGAGFPRAKALMLDEPAAMHRLLAVLAEAVRTYLAAQIAAGAEVVMVFDTWGGLLAPRHHREFSLRYLAAIAAGLERGQGAARTPLILFSKGARDLEGLADTGCEALGLDWNEELGLARARVGARVALQGNLDPAVLYGGAEAIRAEVASTLASYGNGPGHVFNLGHGLSPDMDPARVGILIDAVHELSAGCHAR